MKIGLFTYKVVLRFRRWCRKGYAIFGSLGKRVTIGCLEADICDRSLQKQTKICLPCEVRFSFDRVDEMQQLDLLSDNLPSFYLMPSIINVNKAIAPFSVKEIGSRFFMYYDISGC